MPRSLAQGHKKVILCTAPPVNPAAPTLTELNAGIDISCAILESDYVFGPTDSDKVNEKGLCEENNANALGASNFTAMFTIFRYFDAVNMGQPDGVADAAFQALKVKGSTLYAYERHTLKKSTDALAVGDEIRFGAELLTDNPKDQQQTQGYVKASIPMEPQNGWPYITVH